MSTTIRVLAMNIENIKDKITFQEYKEILENLGKIKVKDIELESNTYLNDSLTEEEQIYIEYERAIEMASELKRLKLHELKEKDLPTELDIKLRIWNGTIVEEWTSRSYHQSRKFLPSGFAQPVTISPELAAFIGIPEGVLVAKPAVTKFLFGYVKKHNLVDSENKRYIDLNKPGGQALRDLLNVPETDKLSYFNIQKYLSKHYTKDDFEDDS